MEQSVKEQFVTYNQLKKLRKTFTDNPSISKGVLSVRIDVVDDHYRRFREVNIKINRIVIAENIVISKEKYFVEDLYSKFELLYMEIKGEILENYPVDSPTSPHHSTTHDIARFQKEEEEPTAKLPDIEIPTFSGKYTDWLSFRDLYISLIHSKTKLPNVQKFLYLKSSLSPDALRLIRHLPVTEANYAVAWKTLEDRYHNEKVIIDSYLTMLFEQPPLTRESSVSTSKLLDTTKECINGLTNMQVDTSSWDLLIIYILVQKMDSETRKKWELSQNSSRKTPELETLYKFLESNFRTLEQLERCKPQTLNKIRSSVKPSSSCSPRNARSFHSANDQPCVCCKQNHFLYQCDTFKSFPFDKRLSFVKSNKFCINCLVPGHFVMNCRQDSRCHICRKSHHTLLHNDVTVRKNPTSNDVDSRPTSFTSATQSSVEQINLHSISSSQVLLATVLFKVLNPSGEEVILRALMDQGSQVSFITEAAAQQLKLKKRSAYLSVNGLGGNRTGVCHKSVTVNIMPCRDNNFTVSVNAFVLPSLTSYLPAHKVKLGGLPELKDYTLADPNFFVPGPIDMLLGADLYGSLLLEGHNKLNNGLLLQNSVFGWIISGPLFDRNTNSSATNFCSLIDIDNTLRKFWEQEEVNSGRALSEEDLRVEDHFRRTHKRDSCGRYSVSLPFKYIVNNLSQPTFENSFSNALVRLKTMERVFKRDPALAYEYSKFMDEYLSLGHMRFVGHFPNPQGVGYFLPHHAVLKSTSSTTKLRVVFDASAQVKNGTSLNEELCSGPPLQRDLPTTILRWRRHCVAFSSDIEKMFRQININSGDEIFQRILWRKAESDPISVFELSTVTYGTTCAPFLAIRCLQQLAEDETSNFPLACEVLKTDTYVDDVISGADDIPSAIKLQSELIELLSRGGFKLRKWTSNKPELLSTVPQEDREIALPLKLEDEHSVKTLGVFWCPSTDEYFYKVNLKPIDQHTKRSLLSDVSKLFDPLGWLSPVTIVGKSLFQRLWLSGTGWDDPLPSEMEPDWRSFRESLHLIEGIRIPRWLGTFTHTIDVELHGFCDASQSAFAAVVYSRIQDPLGVKINILAAKTKVSPVQKVCIPRLELCAALLLARLAKRIQESIGIPNLRAHYWTDSTIVLAWIKQLPIRWEVYVANRVSEIQKLSNISQWRHVSSKDNPADCSSRGIHPGELKGHPLWWTGPEWLRLSPCYWPQRKVSIDTDLEKKPIDVLNVTTREYPDIFSRYSSLNKLIRIMAYWNRFRHNSSVNNRLKLISPILTSHEKQSTLKGLIKCIQQIDFEKELETLHRKKPLKSSSISSLVPFVDDENILRVGGRLSNSDLPIDTKHPILLSKNNPLTYLIIADIHQQTLHGGSQLMLAVSRQKYWILGAKSLMRQYVHRCVICFRHNRSTTAQLMGNLPRERVTQKKPFSHTGVDYAGPIEIRLSRGRNPKISKAYICVFVCLVTKAIHLEAVTDYTTEAFLAAFQRFTARRGQCTDLYSDCGSNFVGARNVLESSLGKSFPLGKEGKEHLSDRGTTWHFIPPATPHFGGLWEAGVKSTKYHLKRIMKERRLTFEELTTLLACIESCLNSRPLSPINDDPNEFEAITPGHFLIGQPTIQIHPEGYLLDNNINHLSAWQTVQRMQQEFWYRWSTEYITRLQQRPKWQQLSRNLQENDMVLVKDERYPPSKWPLGRITQIHPGNDGVVRVATVKLRDSLLKRPITKLALLPLPESKTSDDQ